MKRVARDPEQGRGASSIALAHAQRLLDRDALQDLEGERLARIVAVKAGERGLVQKRFEILLRQGLLILMAEGRGAFQNVFELTHIAGKE